MDRPNQDERELSRAVARIQAWLLAAGFGIVGGAGLFLMTVWLLIRGGEHVGSHLQLLSNYFVGYSVTWTGSLIGFLYGAVTGGLIGWSIATIYNRVADLRSK
ncbi:MAG TPA: hypothetical protein VLA99_08965 [Nitrospiraceae bacterium]|uniref:Uncharacterized protein n=1 Tax=Nitrospira tepida TaxID=2973512 RepID=A0AA86T864_9BACT|nr:hypothetical protein [Nitrospira tepida]CAI4033990.1 hypothetical protein DNFV4_04432 [Nitrospira tepida]HSE58821.1 hypothetical protein [Nitrospiraceae bacterium]